MIPLMLNFSTQQTGTKYRTHTSLHTITDEDDLLRGCSEDTDCQMGKITLAVYSSEFRLKIMQIRPFLTERAKHYAKTMRKDNSAGGAL